MAWFMASLAAPIAAAYAAVACCDRAAQRGLQTFVFRVCLAFGLGIGASSCVCFLYLLFAGPPGAVYRVAETAAFAAIAIAGLFFSRRGCPRTTLEFSCGRPHPLPLSQRARGVMRLRVVFAVVLTLAALGAIASYWRCPFGEWDAIAIWNQRARFLFRAGDDWRTAFSPVFFHTDYPLLLPIGNMRLYSFAGFEIAWTPWLLGSLFTFSTCGVLAVGVARMRTESQGLLAGLVLISTASFLHWGTTQLADVPLAYFMLSAVVLLVLHDHTERTNGGFLFLAGVMAGLAAWTKNEGLLFVVVLLSVRGMVSWRKGGERRAFKEFAVLLAAAAPVLAVVAAEKIFLAGYNDFLAGQSWQALFVRISDPLRYWEIAKAVVYYSLRVAGPFAVFLPILYFMAGASKALRIARGAISTASAVLAVIFCCYLLVYLNTPRDLHWHLKTSMERVLLQLWPLCLLVVFLHIAAPEESFHSKIT